MRKDRRKLAKALYALSGQLSRIKTYQRFYVPFKNEDENWALRYAGRQWGHCSMSLKLMCKALSLDSHSDHWAVEHSSCSPPRAHHVCKVCGSLACALDGE